MRTLTEKLKSLLRDDEGATVVEYGLLASLISIAAIAAIVLIGPKVAALFQSVADELP